MIICNTKASSTFMTTEAIADCMRKCLIKEVSVYEFNKQMITSIQREEGMLSNNQFTGFARMIRFYKICLGSHVNYIRLHYCYDDKKYYIIGEKRKFKKEKRISEITEINRFELMDI